MPADRTPFFCGSLPVDTAAQTASADVGWSVARCITAPASRIRPKFGSRPSAVALVMKSSEPASIATTVTRAGRSVVPMSSVTSIGWASRTGTAPRPRITSGASTEPPATITRSTAHVTRWPGQKCARSNPTTTNSDAKATSDSMPLAISVAVVGSSTIVNVWRLAHMSAAPPAAAAAPSQDRTPTLTHAGENGSRVRSCRTIRQA